MEAMLVKMITTPKSIEVIYTLQLLNAINIFKHEQNGRYFSDDIFNAFAGMKTIAFVFKLHRVLFVLTYPIDDMLALVGVMAEGTKPLSGPMLNEFYRAIMASHGHNKLMTIRISILLHMMCS